MEHLFWLTVLHNGYDALIELFVEIGDHLVTHYILVVVIKAGVVHVGVVIVRRVLRLRKNG